MDTSNVNYVDLSVLAVLAVSGILAFKRGLVHEAFSLGTWVMASMITVKFYPSVKIWMLHHIKNELGADAATAIALFCGTLVILIPFGNLLSNLIKGPTLTSIDRSLGLVFGVLRGFLVVCLLFLCATWIWPEANELPDWLAEAKTKPMLSYGAELIKSYVPKDEQEKMEDGVRKSREAATKAAKDARRLDEISTPVPMVDKSKEDRSPSYGEKYRENMDNLIQQKNEP